MCDRIIALTELLRDRSAMTPAIEAAAIVDNDGLTIASTLEKGVVLALSTALSGMSARTLHELGRGVASLVIHGGRVRWAILARCGPDEILVALAAADTPLRLFSLDATRTARRVGRLVGEARRCPSKCQPSR